MGLGAAFPDLSLVGGTRMHALLAAPSVLRVRAAFYDGTSRVNVFTMAVMWGLIKRSFTWDVGENR